MTIEQKVRFVLNDTLVELAPEHPCQTLLEFIRESRNLTGTKEGCAEGDCGACTVAVAEFGADGNGTYSAVNSCILFTPVLHGKHIITVEHLSQIFGGLHQIQQEMAERHASQCGFCTPGFVMSLFALWSQSTEGAAPKRHDVETALAGNLCRCTGYRPILDASLAALPSLGHKTLNEASQKARRLLASSGSEKSVVINSQNGLFALPTQVDEFSKLVAERPGAVILSGGTDVGLWITKLRKKIPEIIYIGRVKELRRIEETPDSLEIFAGATYTDSMPYLEKLSSAFQELLERIGSRQIRNSGTVVANIANASPIGDMPPVMLALDAELNICRDGETRQLPLKDFFIKYRKTALQEGEWIKSVIIRKSKLAGSLKVYKISKRFDQDISAVCAAILIEESGGAICNVRIAFGGMAEIPKRAAVAESYLTGKPVKALLDKELLNCLAEEFSPISDMRASANYRMTVAGNLLQKYYHEVFASADRLCG